MIPFSVIYSLLCLQYQIAARNRGWGKSPELERTVQTSRNSTVEQGSKKIIVTKKRQGEDEKRNVKQEKKEIKYVMIGSLL